MLYQAIQHLVLKYIFPGWILEWRDSLVILVAILCCSIVLAQVAKFCHAWMAAHYENSMDKPKLLVPFAGILAVGGLTPLIYQQDTNVPRVVLVVLLTIILLIGIFYFLYAGGNLIFDWNSDISKEFRKFGLFTLGLPITVLGSLTLAVLLDATKNQTFTLGVPGFTLEPTTIQTILWGLCFLTLLSSFQVQLIDVQQVSSGATNS